MATGPSEWSTGLPYPGTGGIVEASLSSSSSEERPGQERIKRPHNAWIIYRTEKSREIRDAFLQGLLPAMPSSSSAHAHLLGSGTTPKREADLSKYLAAMWKAEPPNVKEHYSERAKAEREAHLQKHPGYRFQPRKLARSRTMNSLSSLAQQQPSSDHTWPTLALHGDNSAATKLRRAPRSRTADGLGSHLHSEGSEYTSSQGRFSQPPSLSLSQTSQFQLGQTSLPAPSPLHLSSLPQHHSDDGLGQRSLGIGYPSTDQPTTASAHGQLPNHALRFAPTMQGSLLTANSEQGQERSRQGHVDVSVRTLPQPFDSSWSFEGHSVYGAQPSRTPSASDLDSRSSSDKDARDQHAYRSQHGPSHSHAGPAFDQNAAPAGSFPAVWQDVHISSTVPNVQLPSMGSGTASFPGRQRSSTEGQGLGMVSAHPNQHPAQLSPVYARNPMFGNVILNPAPSLQQHQQQPQPITAHSLQQQHQHYLHQQRHPHHLGFPSHHLQPSHEMQQQQQPQQQQQQQHHH